MLQLLCFTMLRSKFSRQILVASSLHAVLVSLHHKSNKEGQLEIRLSGILSGFYVIFSLNQLKG